VLKLAKAKKKRRPPSSGSKPPSGDDDAGGSDEAPATASSGSSGDDDSKEDELLGSSKAKKKEKPTAREEGEAASGSGDGDAPKATKSVETVESKASEEPTGTTVASALEFGVGGKALFRQLSWTSDGANAGLGPYSLSPGPETGLWLEFYPAAFGTSGFASNVGLFGNFDYGFGVATTLANGTNVATNFRDFLGGLKVRIPMGGMFNPNVSLGYGQQVFEIAQQQTTLDIPGVAYQFVRPALGARLTFAPEVALDITAGYLAVLNPGSGADHVRSPRFFPKATSYGIDVSASVAYRLMGSVGLRVGADWRQYGISLKPDSTTRQVAGAIDRYIVAWAGLEVVLDGQGGAAGGDDEPAKPSKRRRRHASEPSDSSDSDSDSSSSSSSSESE
jgi:hypothetical protein